MSLSFTLIFSLLSIIYLIIGVASSRNLKNNNDYFLAGKSLGFFSVFFTLIATQIGGGLVLGTSEEAYSSGYYGILYALGIAIGFIILGIGFAGKLRSFEVATIAELFETKFKSKTLRKCASLLSVLSMSGILVAQIIASRRFLYGINFDSEWLFLLFWTFIILYTVLGGLKAVVATDIFQASFLVALFVLLFFYFLPTLSIPETIEIQKQFFAPTISVTGMFLLPLCFSLIEQDLAQRCFSAETPTTARKAALASGIFILLFATIPVYFGIQAFNLHEEIPINASPLIYFFKGQLSDAAFAFVVCGLLAAIVSTADSLLCAISSNIAQDFEFKFLKIKDPLKLSKTTTLIIGIIAFIIAYRFENILSVLIQSYELPVSCLFVSVMYCYFSEKLNKNAAGLSMAVGLASFILLRIYPLPISREIVTLLLSFLGYLVGSAIFKQKDHSQTT